MARHQKYVDSLTGVLSKEGRFQTDQTARAGRRSSNEHSGAERAYPFVTFFAAPQQVKVLITGEEITYTAGSYKRKGWTQHGWQTFPHVTCTKSKGKQSIPYVGLHRIHSQSAERGKQPPTARK